jgi:hypothetical protein
MEHELEIIVNAFKEFENGTLSEQTAEKVGLCLIHTLFDIEEIDKQLQTQETNPFDIAMYIHHLYNEETYKSFLNMEDELIGDPEVRKELITGMIQAELYKLKMGKRIYKIFDKIEVEEHIFAIDSFFKGHMKIELIKQINEFMTECKNAIEFLKSHSTNPEDENLLSLNSNLLDF